MDPLLKLSAAATGFAILGALLMPYLDASLVFWAFLVCISVSLLLTLTGLLRTRRVMRDWVEAQELLDLWRRQREPH